MSHKVLNTSSLYSCKTKHGQHKFQDRFISTRASIEFLQNYTDREGPYNESTPDETYKLSEDHFQARMYNSLMQSQILGYNFESQENTLNGLEENFAKFRFKETANMANQNSDKRFSLFPIGGLEASYPFDNKRIISKVPYKVLDAPELQDDFYLDVVDWSKENTLAVGLGKSVYLWIASNSKVVKLHEFSGNDSVASVRWSPEGNLLAVGSNKGFIHVWDYVSNKELLHSKVHHGRVGTIAWNPQTLILSTGSRDKTIVHRDIRDGVSPENDIGRSIGHKQEVCGLRWSPDAQYVSSGGNDNKVLIWNKGKLQAPFMKFSDHKAAVKAIAWSPHQNGLLATGGGTTDRCIKLWDINTGMNKGGIDTGSQLCNMMWGMNSNELVTAHGYSSNAVAVWKLNPFKCITQLSGHLSRVLYLSMSPDGRSIVTGSGDETLRFWEIFPPNKYQIGRDQEWDVYPSQGNVR